MRSLWPCAKAAEGRRALGFTVAALASFLSVPVAQGQTLEIRQQHTASPQNTKNFFFEAKGLTGLHFWRRLSTYHAFPGECEQSPCTGPTRSDYHSSDGGGLELALGRQINRYLILGGNVQFATSASSELTKEHTKAMQLGPFLELSAAEHWGPFAQLRIAGALVTERFHSSYVMTGYGIGAAIGYASKPYSGWQFEGGSQVDFIRVKYRTEGDFGVYAGHVRCLAPGFFLGVRSRLF
jgi:hypothetical protein